MEGTDNSVCVVTETKEGQVDSAAKVWKGGGEGGGGRWEGRGAVN